MEYKVKYYIGIIILLFSLINEIWVFIRFFWLNTSVDELYFGFLLVYIASPVIFFSFLIFLFSYLDKENSNERKCFKLVFFLHFLTVFFFYFFFSNEYRKVKFTVKNLSRFDLVDFRIIARDEFCFGTKIFNRMDSLSFICDCREPQKKTEKIGVTVEFKRIIGGKVEYVLVYPNAPIFQNEFKILVRDTIVFFYSDLEENWIKIYNKTPR
jgi:hypothetical protein